MFNAGEQLLSFGERLLRGAGERLLRLGLTESLNGDKDSVVNGWLPRLLSLFMLIAESVGIG